MIRRLRDWLFTPRGAGVYFAVAYLAIIVVWLVAELEIVR